MIHQEPSPLAGKTARILSGELEGYEILIEDWWDRIAGRSWMNCNGNPACLMYAMSSLGDPLDDLRHSLATLVRNRGAARWDLEGFMGHRAASQTETYAIGEFPTVVTALNGIIAEVHRLAPGSLHRNDTGASRPLPQLREVKMPG